MKTAAVIYHTGTGGTRTVAELVARRLEPVCRVRLVDAADRAVAATLEADVFVIGYPVFFLKPSPTILDFVRRLPRFAAPKPAVIFNTMALYAENSLRRFAAVLLEKNIVAAGAVEIKSPASDGTLTFPAGFAPSFYRFEKKVWRKIEAIARAAEIVLADPAARPSPPRFKWYTPLAQLAQVLFFNSFARNRSRLFIDSARCSRCDLCVSACPRRAWRALPDSFTHNPEACELCLRCVHHCPEKAIGWDFKMLDKPRLTPALHRELKQELMDLWRSETTMGTIKTMERKRKCLSK